MKLSLVIPVYNETRTLETIVEREVPISYQGRTYEEGKKIGWRDGVRALYCIVKYGIRRPS